MNSNVNFDIADALAEFLRQQTKLHINHTTVRNLSNKHQDDAKSNMLISRLNTTNPSELIAYLSIKATEVIMMKGSIIGRLPASQASDDDTSEFDLSDPNSFYQILDKLIEYMN